MGRVALVLGILVILAVIGGGIFLAYWDFPVSTTRVEKVLPDARFPR